MRVYFFRFFFFFQGMLLLRWFAVLSAPAAVAQKSPAEVRLSYGVICQNTGRMTVATQRWLYTFQLVFPVMNAKKFPKQTAQSSRTQNCNFHNMFVTVINKLSEGLERDVLVTYAQAQSILRTRLNVSPFDNDRLEAAGTQTDYSKIAFQKSFITICR